MSGFLVVAACVVLVGFAALGALAAFVFLISMFTGGYGPWR